MSIDPALAARVAPLHGMTVLEAMTADLPGPRNLSLPDVEVVEEAVEGPDGAVPVRTYRPTGATGPLPALVWCHGGAWIGGDLDMPEAHSVAQRVAAGLPALVVSVDYRLATVAPHPAPVHDIVAAVRAVRTGALGATPTRLALGGASAGGHLAALAACRLRGDDACPDALWLAYPATDPVDGPWPGARPPHCPEVLWFDAGLAGLAFAGYVAGDPAAAPDDAVPARMDLGGLPPTLVTTVDGDALAPQARAFAAALVDAGVPTTHHHVDRLLHGYLNEVAEVPLADAALSGHLRWLASALTAAASRRTHEPGASR